MARKSGITALDRCPFSLPDSAIYSGSNFSYPSYTVEPPEVEKQQTYL